LEKLINDINLWLVPINKNSDKPYLVKPDKALLSDLKEYCNTYDMDGIDRVMIDLEFCEYENDGDLIKWLRDKVDALDVHAVVARIDEYLTNPGEGI
jgi:hypothetical protein